MSVQRSPQPRTASGPSASSTTIGTTHSSPDLSKLSAYDADSRIALRYNRKRPPLDYECECTDEIKELRSELGRMGQMLEKYVDSNDQIMNKMQESLLGVNTQISELKSFHEQTLYYLYSLLHTKETQTLHLIGENTSQINEIKSSTSNITEGQKELHSTVSQLEKQVRQDEQKIVSLESDLNTLKQSSQFQPDSSKINSQPREKNIIIVGVPEQTTTDAQEGMTKDKQQLSLFLSVTISGEIPCDVIYGDGRGHNTEISGEEVGYQNGIALLEFGKSIGPNSEATLNVRGTIRPANTNVNDNTSHHSTSDNQNGIASNLVSKANVEGAAITANTNANNLVSTANVTGATISANTDVNDNTQHHNQEAIPSEQADTPYNQSGIANNLVSMAKVTGAAITANTNANNLVSPANVTGPTITANTNANNLGSTANVTGATITANTDVHDNTQHHNQESNPSNLVSTTNVQGATITANTHVGDNTRPKRESEGDIPSNQAGSLPTLEGISSNPVGTPNVEDATKNKNVNDNTQHQTGPSNNQDVPSNPVGPPNVEDATANAIVSDNTHQTGTSNNQDVPSNPAGPPNVEGATPNVKGTPLIGSDEGSVKETNTSSSWGLNAGVDAGLSLGAGVKDGHAVIGANKHVDANIGGHEESSSKETNHPLFPTPPPNTYGPGYGLPNYPNQQFPSQFSPQAGQQLIYVPQPRQQYPQMSQFGPQYAQQPYGPQYGQQPYGPQYGQQPFDPQFVQQSYGLKFAPLDQQPSGPQFVEQSYGLKFAPLDQQPTGLPLDQQPASPDFAQQLKRSS